MNQPWIKIPLLVLLSGVTCSAGGEPPSIPMSGIAAPTLKIHQTTNGDELLLIISDAEPKKFYILSSSSSPDSTWKIEALIDCAVSNSIVISTIGKPQGFFKVVTESEFNAVGASQSGRLETAGTTANAKVVIRGRGNEWFVDRKNGNDNLDGRTKHRNGESGPFGTISKALKNAREGDSITIAEGIYPEDIDLRGRNISVRIEGHVILH